MSAELDLAREVIGRLGRASGFLDRDESRTELKLGCEVAKETLSRGVQSLVEPAGQRPMLTSKSCDGTPITIVHRETRYQPSGRAVRSEGNQCVEFLVQNQFVRCQLGPNDWHTKILLSEPTPLWRGKAIPAILAAARRDLKTLRALGHVGCAVDHDCWNRIGNASAACAHQ